MKKGVRRLLCALLVLVMVICIAPVPMVSAASAEDRLDNFNETIYNFLKTQIKAVANGEKTSAEFQISDPNGILKWTKAELGVSTLVSGGAFTQEALDAASAKFNQVFDFQKVNNTLMVELPYDLYWHDKTAGVSMLSSRSGNSNEIKITSITFRFAVSQDYASGTYTTNPAKITAAKSVTGAVQAIVAKHAGKSDLEKLAAYRDEICQLVSYNHTAADNNSTPYGNPWQLINVFDGDTTTNVVCEGYSKAFKYLCDLTDFDGEVECHLVDGYMQGGTGAGGHMWNVVEIAGGVLLVDVTNCDAGTVGAPDKLFLKVGQKNGNTYSFDCGSQTINYTYSSTEENLHTDGYLELKPMTAQDPEGGECSHSYKTATTRATFTQPGSIVTSCEHCGDVSGRQTIPAVSSAVLSATTYTYDGQVKTPTVTLKDSGGKTLTEGTDYTVTYDSGRIAAGIYNVTITLKGKYSGTKTLTFEIQPKITELKITTQPKTVKVKVGSSVKYTVKAEGDGLTYQWQSSTDGKKWKNCSSSSAKKASFTFTSKISHSSNYYRCRITDAYGNTVYTDAVRLYVLGVTTQPKTQKVEAGEKVKFTVGATGAGKTYQWQSSTDGKNWKNCSSASATKATFTFTAKTSHSGNYYRCRIKDNAGNVIYTDAVRLYVLGITTQPTAKTVTKGKTVKFTVTATGASKVYQWQVSTNGGKTWKNCSSTSAKKAAFTFTAKTSHSGNYYRCRVKDSGGNTVYSSKVKLIVK